LARVASVTLDTLARSNCAPPCGPLGRARQVGGEGRVGSKIGCGRHSAGWRRGCAMIPIRRSRTRRGGGAVAGRRIRSAHCWAGAPAVAAWRGAVIGAARWRHHRTSGAGRASRRAGSAARLMRRRCRRSRAAPPGGAVGGERAHGILRHGRARALRAMRALSCRAYTHRICDGGHSGARIRLAATRRALWLWR